MYELRQLIISSLLTIQPLKELLRLVIANSRDLYADNCNSGYVMVCSNCFLWMTAVININTMMPPWYPVVKTIVTTQSNIDIGSICRLFLLVETT